MIYKRFSEKLRSILKEFKDYSFLFKFITLLIVFFSFLRIPLALISPVTGDAGKHAMIIRGVATGDIPIPILWSFQDVFFMKEEVLLSNPPLFYIISTVFYKIGGFFGYGLAFAKMVSPLCSILLIYLTFLFGKKISKEVGLFSAFIASVIPYNIVMGSVLYRNMLFALLFILVIYYLAKLDKYKENRFVIVSGVLLGLLLLSKKQAPIIFPFLLYVGYKSNIKKKVFYSTLIGVIIALPMFIRNLVMFKKPIVIRTLATKTASFPSSSLFDFSITSIRNFYVGYLEMWGVPAGDLGTAFGYINNYLFDELAFFLTVGWVVITAICSLIFVMGYKEYRISSYQNRFLKYLEVSSLILILMLVYLTFFKPQLPKYRHILPISVLFSICGAIILSKIRKGKNMLSPNKNVAILLIVIVLFLSLTMVPIFKPIIAKEDVSRYDEAINWIKDNAEEGETIINPFSTYVSYKTKTTSIWSTDLSDINSILRQNTSNIIFLPKQYEKQENMDKIKEGLRDFSSLKTVYEDQNSIIYKYIG
ncbi:hypothetical protein C9439_04010 [archaeon SCG-AAA382B04]|nr:hypothetical protein C9439_04010 [archaeon SCG-AAA382B04]